MLWNFFPWRSERDTGASIFPIAVHVLVAARLPGSNEGPSHPAYTCYYGSYGRLPFSAGVLKTASRQPSWFVAEDIRYPSPQEQ